MTDPLALFSLPQTESQARTTTVREHSRVVTPRVRRSDPETSRNAARVVAANADALTALILAAFRACGPLNDDELVSELLSQNPYLLPATIKTCRSRLKNAGQLMASGPKRRSARGVPSTVWRLA